MVKCVCRTLKAFDTWLKKGARGTDYVFPSEMLVMMNVIVDFKNQHRYSEDEFLDHIQADMRSSLMERVCYCVKLDFLSPTQTRNSRTRLISSPVQTAPVLAYHRNCSGLKAVFYSKLCRVYYHCFHLIYVIYQQQSIEVTQ